MSTPVLRGPCSEPSCGAPGEGVRLEPPRPGRPFVVGGPYCEAHGGAERARAEADADWMIRAPASVGDASAVLEAGTAALRTSERYVVLRSRGGGWWSAGIGLGSRLEELSGVWASELDACAYGAHVWRQRLEARLRELHELRGGDIGWGIPVAPPPAPLVVRLEGAGNAYDEAAGARFAEPDPRRVVTPADVRSELVLYPGVVEASTLDGERARWTRGADGRWTCDDTETAWPGPSRRARDLLSLARTKPDFREVVTAGHGAGGEVRARRRG